MSTPAPNLPQGVVGLTLSPGDRVQHYTVVQPVGAGGTSAVFKAHDALLNRHVAIKQVLLAPGEEADAYRARALAEADAHKKAAATDPTMLVQLIDVVADARGVLLITEFVDGPSLEQILQANPAPMDERQALGILAGAAKGLASLHAAGLLHRDIKPPNILMPRAGGLRLADFGLSVSAATGMPMDQGTVRYMAPEILQDQPATPGSDLYALGMVAYEMLAGRAQFDEAFKAILRDQRNQSMRWLKWHTNPKIKSVPLAQLNPALSPAVVELVERLMDKDPVRRINSAGDLLNAIRTIVSAPAPAAGRDAPPPWLAGQGPEIPAAPAAATARVPRQRKWPMVAASFGIAVLVLAIGAKLAMESGKPDPEAAQRARILDLLNQGEDAWKARDFGAALDIFQSMQSGGREERAPGTLSRRFADAGAAKCRAELAFARKDYAGALAAAAEFRQFADELEKSEDFRRRAAAPGPGGKYPPGALHVAPAELSELAARMQKPTERFQVRKDVADAIAGMRALLEAGKTRDCTGLCNEWLARSGVLDEERSAIRKILAECGMTRNERRLERLLDDAKALAATGDIQGATRLLSDEIRLQGDDADPRVGELQDTILDKARLSQMTAKYQAADGLEEKISLLNAILTLDPAFPDKAKLPALRADLLCAQAETAFRDGDFAGAGRKAAQGLELSPRHEGLLALRRALAHLAAQAKLTADADELYGAGRFAEAIAAYEAVVAKTDSDEAKAKAKERIAECRGKVKLAEALLLIRNGELARAEAALKAAQEDLPDNADVAAGFERIKELRQEQDLRESAAHAFNRGDHAAAVPFYAKLVAFLKEHPTAGNLAAAEERLRQCRFESTLLKLEEATARREWASARGIAAVAKSYAATDDDKKRLEADRVKLEQLIKASE